MKPIGTPMAATFAAIVQARKSNASLMIGFRNQRTNPMREFFRSIKPRPQDAFAAISLALFWMALYAIAERII
jgi:hypothetical protein